MRHRNFFYAVFAGASIIAATLPLCSCGDPSAMIGPSRARVTVMTWNTQTFFDAVEAGTEFDEFRGGKNGWNAEKYGERLDRLCDVIALCGKRAGEEPGAGPDIAVLEEIENEGVVRDICNRLQQRTTYRYAAFVPPSAGSAFGSAVLSRFPVTGITAHSVDPVTSSGGESLSLRPMLEVTLQVGDETLTVFAVHWKSKTGETGNAGVAGVGEASDGDESPGTADPSLVAPSARARLAQERLLAERIATLGAERPLWVACGDFNQKRDEFTCLGDYANCWDAWLERCESGDVAGPAGSYFYDDSWETIDNVFVPKSFLSGDPASSLWAVTDYRVIAESPIADDDLRPNRYAIFSGKGVSDHLPLVLTLEKRN